MTYPTANPTPYLAGHLPTRALPGVRSEDGQASEGVELAAGPGQPSADGTPHYQGPCAPASFSPHSSRRASFNPAVPFCGTYRPSPGVQLAPGASFPVAA